MLLHVRGGRRKGNSVVQNGTVSVLSLFFFLFFVGILYMKRRRFGENAPFHLKKRRQNTQNFNSALNYLLILSIASLPISVLTLIVGRVFHLGPWPLIYAIKPSIDQ